MDSVQIQFLGALGDAHLVSVGAGLSLHTLLKVGLRIPYHIAQQLGELGGMFGLLERIALESLGHFGITLAVGLARHCQIHAHLAALAVEVCVQVLYHLLVATLGHAHLMLGDELKQSFRVKFFELALGCAADRAFLRSFRTLVDVTAYHADKFLVHNRS